VIQRAICEHRTNGPIDRTNYQATAITIDILDGMTNTRSP